MHDSKIAWAALAAVALAGRAPATAQEHPLAPTRLRCELLVEPLGLDVSEPRLSWEVVDPRRGATQLAYRVLVTDDAARLDREEGSLWDSGMVVAGPTPFVKYAGAPLRRGQLAFWRVRTFDVEGHASPWSDTARFALGPIDDMEWRADWIRDATPPPPFAPAHNGFHSEFTARPDEFQWVQIDLGRATVFDTIRLWPARPFDWADTPGFLFPVRFRVWVGDDPTFQTAFLTVVDRNASDFKNPGEAPVEFALARMNVRYVRLGVSKMGGVESGGELRHAFALAEMQVLLRGEDVARGTSVSSSGAIESGAWSPAKLVDGDLRSHAATPQAALPSPMFRKSFRVDGQVTRATLYSTALGVYRLSLNGQRVGDDELAPGWTDYHRRVPYQTWDVTSLVRPGENVIGALVGDGWYAGRLGLAAIMPGYPTRGIYGRRPSVCAELSIELAGGERITIASGGSWKSTLAGPIRSADLLDGEVYDARSELPGWDAPGFDDAAWTNAEVAQDVHPKRVAQRCEPIRVTRELAPVALTEPSPGVHVFDLGQNMVGWCRLSVRGDAGAQVKLRHGEMLDELGQLYTANLRGARQTDVFTLRGEGEEILEPHFTYHGFRYVEVTGLAHAPALGDLTGRVVHTAAREVGSFECSDPMLNQLWQNILWTQRANLTSVPTDCPQRDERLGWMGDIQAFAPTAAFQMDLGAFFDKWLTDVRDAQASDGRFPDFAPHPFGPDQRFSGVPAWGDAGVVVPWCAYVNYGDTALLEAHWASVVRWITWIRANNPDLVWRTARGNDYGDWLNGDTLTAEGWSKSGGEVPKEVLATAFFAHSVDIAAKMARVLGKTEAAREYDVLYRDIKGAFCRAFLGDDGVLLGDTQAGYALALAFDLVPETGRERALKRLVQGIEARGRALTTGMMATHHALLELSRGGHHELACAVATRHDFPSWGFAIDRGATTVWERWDGFVPGRGFQDAGMNSFNHWAFGSIGEWLMRMVAGIEPDENAPGWKHFTIRPRPGTITHARGVYDSIRGRIVSDWRVDGDEFRLDVEIPANTSALVCVPANDVDVVTEGGRPAEGTAGVRQVAWGEYEVGAGRYQFKVKTSRR